MMKQMETERLRIRKFSPDDWEDLYDYLSNPQVVQYEPYDVFTREECRQEAKERYEDKENSPFWAVCLKESSKLIGHIYFSQVEPMKFKTWTIGYVFNPKYYGRGYATEASARILQYGFEECHAHRIVAGVNVNNTSSWKLLERLSMRREAHMLKNVFFATASDGEPIWHDAYKYAILSSEYRV